MEKKRYFSPEVHAHQMGDVRVMQTSFTESTDVSRTVDDGAQLGAKENIGGSWTETDEDSPW